MASLHPWLDGEQNARAAPGAQRCLKEAAFARLKTREGFDFSPNPSLPEVRLRQLAQGGYIEAGETLIFLGEPGTGKTHIATALGVAGAERGQRVRWTTTGELVNERGEAKDAHALSRLVAPHAPLDLLVLDELG